MDKLRVGIVGVAGYGGGELARLLALHPHAELTCAMSGTYAGQPLSAALPGITRGLSLACENFDPAVAAEKCDLLFLAGEAGLAMKSAPLLLERGTKIIDLSADFRLQDPVAYKEWYRSEHSAPHLLPRAVYGLPELNKAQLPGAVLVANPGCHVTAAVLALAPLLHAKIVETNSLIVDSLTGVSGAGRSKFGLDYHFAEINESLRPYGVGGVHRHTPEIEQSLAQVAGQPITLTFTPHLVPITRGILATCYATLSGPSSPPLSSAGGVAHSVRAGSLPPPTPPELGVGGASGADLHRLFRAFYADAPFVTVLDPGQFPATKHVHGTNFCHIGLAVDKRTNRVIVVSAIDNLGKGAAGQAIQNMNLACGWDETAGLTMGAVWP